MGQNVYQHTFANGLTLLAERMDHVRSAAVSFLVPAGYVYDPPQRAGLASLLAELVTRGAGARASRELSLALDNLGLDRDESVGAMHMRFWAGTLARNLPAALELYADILRRPHLPAEDLDAVKALALQDLQSIEDEPQYKVMVELRRGFFPSPLGRDYRGTPEGVAGVTIDQVRAHHRAIFHPRGTILSVAGQIDWQALRDQVEALFGDWSGGEQGQLRLRKPARGRRHLAKETAQTHIAVAYPSVPFGHPEYYAAQGAVNILSGGFSSRLFTEVREKHGLCYAISASYSTFKDHAGICCYAGTTNERAQKTLDLTLAELVRLREGVSREEVERVQAGLKASLVMQEESTSARAGALASDWFYLRRVRSLDEIQAAVDGLSPRRILSHLRRHPPRDFTIVTIGPKRLRFRLPRKRVASR